MFFRHFLFPIVQSKIILEILYDVGRQTHNYETTAYVLYYALLHNCQITSININDIITSQDCIYMLMAYLYCKHWNMQSDINTLHTYALGLSSKDPNTSILYGFLHMKHWTQQN